MRTWLLACLLACIAAPAIAQPLPMRAYSVADGLAHDRVKRVVADSRGLLWFCTPEGLSRFDGSRFTTYKEAQGLPFDSVNDLLETRAGDYWLATNGAGVARVSDGITFNTVPVGDSAATNRVNIVYEDRAGRIWAGTDAGLFVRAADGAAPAFQHVPLAAGLGLTFEPQVWAMAETAAHGLLVGTSEGLLARAGDGTQRLLPTAGRRQVPIRALLTIDERVWVGYAAGVATLAADGDAAEPRLDSAAVLALARRGDVVWAGTLAGDLVALDRATLAVRERHTGVARSGVISLAVDRGDGLWIGTRAEGSLRLLSTTLVPFGEGTGLPPLPVRVITESLRGDIYVLSEHAGQPLFVLDGARFAAVMTPAAVGADPQIVRQDRRGRWWFGSQKGLVRFPAAATAAALRQARPDAVYTTRDGLPHDSVYALFEDSAARMWIGTAAAAHVTYLDPDLAAMHDVPTAALGMPALQPKVFAEDRGGNIWIGGRNGEVVRFRGGRLEAIAAPRPLREIAGLLVDDAGRVWIASVAGVYRIDTPAAERPVLVEVNGLTSKLTRFVVEDPLGRLYVGLPSGVNRLDPDTGVVELYTPADGLRGFELMTSLRDRQGNVWFGTYNGVTRLAPAPETAEPPGATAYIGTVRVDGVARPASLLGASSLGPLDLDWSQNHVAIDYFAVTLRSGEAVAFRYRLEGADDAWSAPTTGTTVTYPSLPPGRYRFAVQAVAPVPGTAAEAATVAFTIHAPLWQRGWFLTLAGIGLLTAAWFGYRYRLARLLEVERLRTRIATDLHDDIGASLSRITILSEVAQQRLAARPEERQMLSTIADAARGTIDAMSDIVWTISPDRDSVHDLTRRMREFASDQLAARGIDFTFDTPPLSVQRALGLQVRREILLIFKEAITNSARHSGATAVASALALQGRTLCLSVTDNGHGFTAGEVEDGDGNGLGNMTRRARSLGGRLTIASDPERGTSIVATVPL